VLIDAYVYRAPDVKFGTTMHAAITLTFGFDHYAIIIWFIEPVPLQYGRLEFSVR